MFKIKDLFVAAALVGFSCNAYAKPIVPDTLNFGEVKAGEKSIQKLEISADSKYGVTIKSINLIGDNNCFSVENFVSVNIDPNSKASFNINYTSKHNLTNNTTAYIRVDENGSSYSIPVVLHAKCVYSDPYYGFTQNLSGKTLSDSLSAFERRAKSYTYKDARTYMWSTLDNVAGDVECVYTGRKVTTSAIPDVNTTHFNTEHTWPQAFGADNDPAQSDLFHIRPTYEYANTARGNYPFGIPVTKINYNEGGSRCGVDSTGKFVFEVRDVNKGDIARGLFYFALRYNTNLDYLAPQEALLKTWAKFDPVDAKEQTRCDNIYTFQKNRNPFIDHPEFLERIYLISDATKRDFPNFVSINSPDSSITKIITNPNDNSIMVYLYNSGNSDFTLSNPTLSGADKDSFTLPVNLLPITIKPNTFFSYPVMVSKIPAFGKLINSIVEFIGDNNKKIKVNLVASSQEVGVENETNADYKAISYPNPATESVTIKVNAPATELNGTQIKFYNAAGAEVLVKTSAFNSNGNESTLIVNKNELGVGVFYYKIKLHNKEISSYLILN